MTAEQIEASRKARAAKVTDAWAELSMSSAFKTVLEDAQIHFGMFIESFRQADGYNPHAAAQRDGQKAVLAFFALRVARGEALSENENIAKPSQAIT
jgi:hypothetical protein